MTNNTQPLTLAVHHLIHLTREQRYALHAGEQVKTVGVSVPVWFIGENSTEPAKEVFCNYYLSNPKGDFPIGIRKDGYSIPLPHKPAPPLPEVTDEEWFRMNKEERAAYDEQVKPGFTSENLLDIPDGGSKFLYYREHNRIKHEGRWLTIIHFVQISDMADLTESLTLQDSPEAESPAEE
jgi:hypothetical protein